MSPRIMTRICTSQTRAVSDLGLEALYDGGSKDLRVEMVSDIFRKRTLFDFTHEYHLLPQYP